MHGYRKRGRMKTHLEKFREMVRRLFVIIAVTCSTLSPGQLPAAAPFNAGEIVVMQRSRILTPRETTGFRIGAPETLKFYCGNTIIAPGESRANVLATCGEPAWREKREDTRTKAYLHGRTPVNFVTTEEWSYNFGSRQFLHFLRFQGDRLAVIETGGYGFDDVGDFGRNCGDGRNISLGDRKLEVLVKCGEPMGSAAGGVAPVESDQWSYNFGPDRFVYFIQFRYGKVYDIRTGGYGH